VEARDSTRIDRAASRAGGKQRIQFADRGNRRRGCQAHWMLDLPLLEPPVRLGAISKQVRKTVGTGHDADCKGRGPFKAKARGRSADRENIPALPALPARVGHTRREPSVATSTPFSASSVPVWSRRTVYSRRTESYDLRQVMSTNQERPDRSLAAFVVGYFVILVAWYWWSLRTEGVIVAVVSVVALFLFEMPALVAAVLAMWLMAPPRRLRLSLYGVFLLLIGLELFAFGRADVDGLTRSVSGHWRGLLAYGSRMCVLTMAFFFGAWAARLSSGRAPSAES
jgi:hypothetical protein